MQSLGTPDTDRVTPPPEVSPTAYRCTGRSGRCRSGESLHSYRCGLFGARLPGFIHHSDSGALAAIFGKIGSARRQLPPSALAVGQEISSTLNHDENLGLRVLGGRIFSGCSRVEQQARCFPSGRPAAGFHSDHQSERLSAAVIVPSSFPFSPPHVIFQLD